MAAPETNDMFSDDRETALAYQWQDKKHRHVFDLCLIAEALLADLEAARATALEEAAKLAARGFANRKVFIAPSPHLAEAIRALKETET